MKSHNDAENEGPPPSPLEDDCCGNACNPCVFDIHRKLMEEWQKKKTNKFKRTPDKNYLSILQYHKFIIKDITPASKDCIFLLITIASENESDIIFLSPSQYIIMRLITVSKSYTPISWNEKNIKLLIKLYSDGKASACIRKLSIGDNVFIRGPYGEFKYHCNNYNHIVMFSIGSGIAAMYPLAVSIVENDLENTKISMAAGFRSLEHVPLKNELRLLADYWNFECTLYLSQQCTVDITGIKIVNNRLNECVIIETLFSLSPVSSLILICGTLEFTQTIEKIITERNFFCYHVFR